MTQKILASNEKIVTSSEPWLMLYALAPITHTFNPSFEEDDLAKAHFAEVIKLLPNQREDLTRIIRQSCGSIYSMLLGNHPDKIFLDKTPRYYRIVPELLEIFPSSKIVILLRHPLAVLSSILTTWAEPNYGALRHHRNDLLLAPKLLADSIVLNKDNIRIVRYEELLQLPEKTMQELCEWLNIGYSGAMLEYGAVHKEKWRWGDQKKVYTRGDIDRDNQDRWQLELQKPERWRLFKDYADVLGEELFQRLGYSWEQTNLLLNQSRPKLLDRAISVSLVAALNEPYAHSVFGLLRSRTKRKIRNLLY